MSNTSPIATVIVPVFNGSAFLADALASVRAEGKGRLRLVVVDDGSADRSTDIVRAFADVAGDVTLIEHGGNRGVAAARNTGLKAATTPLIAFIDQDDRWAPGRLDAQLAALDDDPGLDFVLGRQLFHVASGLDRPRWAKERYFDGPQAGYVFGTMLAHRRCFERTGLLNEELRHGTDDVDWFARARNAGLRHVTLAQTVLHRTVHDGNQSRLTEGHNSELLRVMQASMRARRAASETAP
ncbi:MAG: glycosyltransferase family 2 protein [Rhodospirillaceae bacterium]|nr:glycosyltransferase family 2 protein [Rhodospirillaceae bacterium]